MLLFQIVDGVQAVQNNLPSSWIDEPHEKILWALVSVLITIVSAIMAYIGNQLSARKSYDEHTKEAAEKLTNPRSDRTINGKTNSAQLLNYVIDDVRENRDELKSLGKKLEALSARVEELRDRL